MAKYKQTLSKLSKRIQVMRKAKGLTLEKLAYENEISKGNLSDIENGKRSPSLATLIKIANGLDCQVRDLIDF